MKRMPVTSSNVVSIGYEEETHTVEVEFKGMSVYQYQGVPPDVYESFMAAGSKGSFVQRTLKRFPCVKL